MTVNVRSVAKQVKFKDVKMILGFLRLPIVFDLLHLSFFRHLGPHVIGERDNVSEYTGADLTGRIDFKRGTKNTVRIGAGSKVPGKITIEGSANTVNIGKKCIFRGDILIKGNNQSVTIGDHTTTGGGTYILCSEDCAVHIGHHCMLSREIEIRTTDAHALIDRKTATRINPAASVRIGDHVWIGVRSIITKGAVVPTDTTIGAMSFVNGQFDEESTVIAGVPAKVIRRDTTWSRGRRPRIKLAKIDAWRR